MKRPSPAITILTLFWAVYGIVASVALYRALPPLHRELLAILGGGGAALAAASVALLWRMRPGAHDEGSR